MTGIDARVITKAEEHGANRSDQRGVVPPWQIRATNGTSEQRVADEQVLPRPTGRANLQTDPARAVAGRVMRPCIEVSERDRLPGRVEMVGPGRWRINAKTEHLSL